MNETSDHSANRKILRVIPMAAPIPVMAAIMGTYLNIPFSPRFVKYMA